MSGMTLWKARIRKQCGFYADDWENVYHLNAANLGSAVSAAQAIVAIERAVHTTHVSFVDLAVAPALLPPGGGTVVGLNLLGQRTPGTDPMPVVNVARIILRPATGKPSMKYLRLPLYDDDTSGQGLVTARISHLTANYCSPLMAVAELVDPQGQVFTGITVAPLAGMRQPRRKRRSRPGFRRDWVAV